MDKLRYMISDAANMVNVEAHVLRYWEEELELDIPRNEMGHRYYTKENIQQFLKIKELKEQGYQLKAIKMVVHNGKNPEEAAALTTGALAEKCTLSQSNTTVWQKQNMTAEPEDYTASEDKMAQFRLLMSGIVKEALAENNQALGREVGENVGERVLKEMNYLVREQDELEEERFRKLDTAIRELNVKKLKGSVKKKEQRRLFTKKEATT